MEEQINNPQPQSAATLPEVPDLLRQDQWFGMDVSAYWLQDDEKYEQPVWSLQWHGIPFAPLGNIHALTGQSGHGKTMTFSQLITAILGGQFGDLRCVLPEGVPRTVLYVDTEMGKNDTLRVRERVFRLLGWRWGEHHPEFRILRLRDVQPPAPPTNNPPATENAPKQPKTTQTGLSLQEAKIVVLRWKMILQAIWEVRPTVCVIDGMLDIIANYNDIEECQEIITKCMQVSSYYNISLWCLVHQNPGRIDKMAGSLGSTLERKVTDILTTVKEKDKDTGSVTFTVQQLKARGADVPDWKYCVDDDREHVGMPRILGSETEAMKPDQHQQYREELDEIFRQCNFQPGGMRYTELETAIKRLGYSSKRKIQKIFQDGQSEGIIKKDTVNGRYYYNGLSGTEAKPSAEQQEMPFGTGPSGEVPF